MKNMKKKLGIILGAVAVSAVAAGVLAGVVAQWDDDDADNPFGREIAERVAMILDVPSEDVRTAFDQAKTATDADDDVDGLSFSEHAAVALGLPSEEVEAALEQSKQGLLDERFDSYLAQQIASGKITQEKADGMREWRGSKPEADEFGDDGPGMS